MRHEENGEVTLQSYKAASSQRTLFDEIVGLVAKGMSQRSVESASKSKISKSSISRMWEDKSSERFALLRERLLGQTEWLAVMIDGVFIGKELCVVIALSIDSGGRKQVLNFESGSSESPETLSRLIDRLKKRGVRSTENSACATGSLLRPSPKTKLMLAHRILDRKKLPYGSPPSFSVLWDLPTVSVNTSTS